MPHGIIEEHSNPSVTLIAITFDLVRMSEEDRIMTRGMKRTDDELVVR